MIISGDSSNSTVGKMIEMHERWIFKKCINYECIFLFFMIASFKKLRT
jgi:hypothetical protein